MLLVSIATMLGALTTDSYLRREGLDGVEAYVLMLLAGTGAMLMAESGGLIMLFLGLEIMSIALYVMAAYHRRRTESGEAGFKYFILGSFSSAIFLYGVALVYGATGSTQLDEIATFLARNTLQQQRRPPRRHGPAHRRPRVQGGGRAVPLLDARRLPGVAHPVHRLHGRGGQGGRLRRAAPGPQRGASSPKQSNWRPAIWLIAVLTLLVGSVLAIAQKDLKRMLAYSSISQAGYVLVGVQAASAAGQLPASLFYLFTYTFIVIGTFAVVGVIQGRGRGPQRPRGDPGPGPPPARGWPGRCSCSCWPRPACRSPAGSWPSST